MSQDKWPHNQNENTPPFYDGEWVIATHEITKTPGHPWPYGSKWQVRCEWKEWYNKHHYKWIRAWYVGVYGYKNCECYYAPYLFSSIENFMDEIKEELKEQRKKIKVLKNPYVKRRNKRTRKEAVEGREA